ncbi:MAG: PilZ domain-containing protein [Labilithrix sp.]|nr:PilZ domain-containing protein [Labilithrix sp.]MCW5817288.1 PilZ domain-containing protein [Labilithrix sp.]
MESAAPLGRLLVSSGLLTQEKLDEALAVQKAEGKRLGDVLADKGLVRPHQLAQFLSHQLACPWVSLQRVEIAPEAVEKLPREIARRHFMIPVHLRTSRGSTALYVAMDDPTDDVALSEATSAATMPVKPMVALASEIKEHLDRLYPAPPEPSPLPPIVVPEGSFPPVSPKTNPQMPRPAVSKPPPPLPISKATQASVSTPQPPPVILRESSSVIEVSAVLEASELFDEPAPESHSPGATPHILVIGAKEELFARVRAASRSVAAFATSASIPEAKEEVANTTICAFVVGAEIYANERAAIDRLAHDANAPIIVSNELFTGPQLYGLLKGSVERWRRAAYEKGNVLEGRYELLRDLTPRTRPKRVVTWEVKHVRTARRSIAKIGLRANDYSGVRREQYALARVHHPGALELRDAGTTELGDPFIVVESAEGKTLEGLVAARGALETQEACAIVRQLAEVLAAAHEAGVRHSSVRPEHVVIARDAWGTERVKLVGWEAASVDDATSDTGPDLSGVGACAFLALVGRPAGDKEDATAAIKDAALAPVVKRALAKEGSVKDFADALADAMKAREPTTVLTAVPEKRGASMRPPAAPPAESPKELRRFPRAPYRTPVRVEIAGIGAVDGRSEDISAGGLFVVTRGHIADRAQVTIRFALPIDGKVVSEMAIVKWSRAPNADDVGAVRAIGIELVSPGAETTKQVARYVQLMASEQV